LILRTGEILIAVECQNNGGLCLKRKYVILLALLALLFTAILSICQGIPISLGVSGSTTESQITASSMSTTGQPIETPAANTSTENLRYIWSVTGIESDQIIMALDQDGGDLFGQAKYEPDSGESWNGDVAGFIIGDEVHLVITALKGDKQDTAVLDGIFAEDAIKGKFFRTSEGKISGRGEFNAIWINPDLSSYTPAEVNEPKPEIPVIANVTAPSGANQADQQKTIYHDVHEDADRIMTGVGDISQIPIGMGGSGLA
jgi:hypothetical protein